MSVSDNFPEIRPSLLLDFANTGSLDPRITFTRSTTAVFYDGVTTAMAEQNLAAYSQTFTAPVWNTGSVTQTTGQTAPDGTSTAVKIAAKTNTGQHYAGILNTMGSALTLSCYVKAAGSNIVRIDGNSGSETAVFDLSTGTVDTVTGAGVTASITDVGNGWYRCVVVLVTARNSFVIWPDAQQGSYAGNDVDGVIIWGAQAENRSFVTAYTATTTQPITNYIPALQTAAANVARFDHNPVTGEALGLLIEEQRTNLLLRSSEFDDAAWSKVRASITANAVVGPDGTATADKLVEDTTASNSHSTTQFVNAPAANSTVTATIYIKAAERTFAQIRLIDNAANVNGGLNQYDIAVNLSDGSVGTVYSAGSPINPSYTVVSAGNGWWRCSLTLTKKGDAVRTDFTIYPWTSNNAASNPTYTGNGYDGIFIWGAQLEVGAFATSYIATTTAATTRTADAASMTGTNFSSWYAIDQGSVYAELTTPVPASTTNGFYWYATDGTTSNRIELYQGGSGDASPRIIALFRYLNSTVANFTVLTTTAGWTTNNVNPAKISFAYKINDAYLVSDRGNAPATATPTGIPNINQVAFSGSYHYKKIAYYPQRLTSAQLQALTS